MGTEYETIKLLKQSEKSTVHLVRAKDGGQIYVRKELKGSHPVYQALLDCPHPCLPKLNEVSLTESSTTVLEEYIDGQSIGTVELSKKQFLNVIQELCSTLEFLHKRGIIHRDIKPSNILFTKDGHIYLIDFDAARMPKNGAEQDTVLLGTQGFAPPEQYGFSQTDERADIYALGATLNQLLTAKNSKPYYKNVIQKCMNLDPEKRYQSVKQVQWAFSPVRRYLSYCFAALLLVALAGCLAVCLPSIQKESQSNSGNGGLSLSVLPAPESPHWDGETGTAAWGNVPESGSSDERRFLLRLYIRDTETPPDPDDSDWYQETTVRKGGSVTENELHTWNLTPVLAQNGFYYFTIAAAGDGIQYTDSPYAVSDVFHYTGEDAPELPVPTDLTWAIYESPKDNAKTYYATWSNLDDYSDNDWFNVTAYDKTGAYVMNNTWPKSRISEIGRGGIQVRREYLIAGADTAYRFTVQVYSSRPNEYHSSPMPDPAPEEYYSPWLVFGSHGNQ